MKVLPLFDEAVMTAKADLYAAEVALERKARGITRALADPRLAYWKAAFRKAVAARCASGMEFTADDIVAEIGLPRESRTNRNNVVGGMMYTLARAGEIRPCGLARAAREQSRARLVRVWKGVRGSTGVSLQEGAVV